MKEFQWWSPKRQTTETYLRTNRKDWFAAVRKISKEIENSKRIIDIGCGDGHSTRQILAFTGKKDFDLTLVEPSKEGIKKSKKWLKDYNIVKTFRKRLCDLKSKKGAYDVALLIHSNYYLGRDGKSDTEKTYLESLKKLAQISKKIIILTAPKESAYYKVIENNPFGEWVFPEYIENYYKKNNFKVKKIDSPIRLFVDDLDFDISAAIEFWKFIKDTEGKPRKEEIKEFISKIKREKSNGQINFRDIILVIEK